MSKVQKAGCILINTKDHTIALVRRKVDEYHNYWFHTKGFFIGEGLALIICALAGLIIEFIL